MTQTDDALEPCPFCGNDGMGPIEDSLQVCEMEIEGWRAPRAYTVQCDRCTATMGYSEDEDEAIAAWNRRADLAHDPLADARVKALVEALRDMRRQFSPYPSEDTERWREEHEACEAADAVLAALTKKDEANA